MPPFEESYRSIEAIQRRAVTLPKDISLHRDGSVIVALSNKDLNTSLYEKLGCAVELNRPKLKKASADSVVLIEEVSTSEHSATLKNLQEIGMSTFSATCEKGFIKLLPLLQAASVHTIKVKTACFALTPFVEECWALLITDESPEQWERLKELKPSFIILAPHDNRLHYCRRFFDWLQKSALALPVILNFNYACPPEDLVIQSAAELGALLCDGLGEGVWLSGPYELSALRSLSFNILQAARMRSFKTDFISCPSCGRTLFDLQEVSRRIRERTSHLPGVKIAIMGCIVNGPGEMADADFGYVGSKSGMIDLYIGKRCVEKDINFTDADNRLVELIKKEGRWLEPEYSSQA